MLPTIPPGARIELLIEPAGWWPNDERLQPGMIACYRRAGALVVHRVRRRLRDGRLLLAGDNRSAGAEALEPAAIWGVVTAYETAAGRVAFSGRHGRAVSRLQLAYITLAEALLGGLIERSARARRLYMWPLVLSMRLLRKPCGSNGRA
jgi:hypothetical protein